MAIREVRQIGDELLLKRSKEVKKMTVRTQQLIADMLETMYDHQGVGLAAPQVGVLKRIVVIDIGEGPIILVNPVVTQTSGEQTGEEGCLSVAGKWGHVTRPMKVTVEALNEKMEPVTVTGEGLLARALCHETDHLDGKLYVDLALDGLHDNSERESDAEEDEDEFDEEEYNISGDDEE